MELDSSSQEIWHHRFSVIWHHGKIASGPLQRSQKPCSLFLRRERSDQSKKDAAMKRRKNLKTNNVS